MKLTFQNALYGLFATWICEINPQGLWNVSSVVPSQVSKIFGFFFFMEYVGLCFCHISWCGCIVWKSQKHCHHKKPSREFRDGCVTTYSADVFHLTECAFLVFFFFFSFFFCISTILCWCNVPKCTYKVGDGDQWSVQKEHWSYNCQVYQIVSNWHSSMCCAHSCFRAMFGRS